MRQKLGIVAIVVALIVGAVGVGWLYFRLNPAAWDEFVAEMQGDTSVSAAPRPAKRPARKSGAFVASGTIEAEDVTVAAEMGGRIISVLADEGEDVAAGEVLVKLDQTVMLAERERAEAVVAQAQAAVDAAQAQLALAQAGARPEEIAAAEATTAGAQARLEAAQAEHDAALGQLAAAEAGLATARGQLLAAEAALVSAEAQVAAAQANLDGSEAQLAHVLEMPTQADVAIVQSATDGAQAQLDQLLAGPEDESVEIARLNWELAKNSLWQTQLERDAVKGRPGIPDYQKSLADAAVGAAEISVLMAQLQHALVAKGATDEQIRVAQAAVHQAQAQMDKVQAGATEAEVAMAQAGVDAAKSQLALAKAGVDAASIQVTQAKAGVEAAQAAVIIAQAGVDAAQAGTSAAQAQLDQAQAALDLLKAGARSEEIALLEANVAQAKALVSDAEAALRALDAQLDRMTLAAPVGGIVLERTVHASELAAPSAPLLTLANLDEVTLTVYVPEADLGQVSLGQEVEVTVDAYEDIFTGQVSHIASQAEFTPKNVQTQEERVHMVFAVKVQLDNADHRLKPGMPADAAFQ
jgi:HlyD family secretion protein